MILRARWVVPVDGPPIKNGAVRINGDRIAEVGDAKHVTGQPSLDFVDAVILPGFVNAHTHLELTHLHARVPPTSDFTDWLRRLRNATNGFAIDDDQLRSSVHQGMRQSLAAGVTTVGDITARPTVTRPAMNRGPLNVVSFGEVIAVGRIRRHLADRIEAAIDTTHATDTLSIGISPHAPYTVEAEGFQASVEHAERGDMPVCIHACETRDEQEYTESGGGRFRDYLHDLGLWDDGIRCPQMSPIPWLYNCGALGPRTLLAHGNYLDATDIELLVQTGTHIAYCPRTHAAFGHDPHPFEQLIPAGVNVCIGTDSLASNPSLSILDELRHVRRHREDTSRELLLQLGTLRAAAALGCADDRGSITASKRADLAIIPLSSDGPVDPVENILTSTHGVIAVYVAGRRIDMKRS